MDLLASIPPERKKQKRGNGAVSLVLSSCCRCVLVFLSQVSATDAEPRKEAGRWSLPLGNGDWVTLPAMPGL